MVAADQQAVNGQKLELEVAKMLKEVNQSRTAAKKEEKAVQNETAVFLAGATDKVAAAVDQTLVGAAEEKLADKQAEDPLLADPLLSLEEEEEEDGSEKAKEVASDIASLKTWEKALESTVPLFDPSLFKNDSVAAMDSNDDGLLDKQELMTHILKLIREAHREEFERQKLLNQDQVKDIIKLMDENGDGQLSMDELFSKTTQSEKEKVADERMFNFADGGGGKSKKDGKLDADEMFLLALPQYSADRSGWYKFKAQDHMEEMDENGDKFVTWKEMENVLKSYEMEDADNVIKRFKDNFDTTDTNSDGKLDEAEMAKMVEAMETEDMAVVVDGLIEKADDNGDKKLSLDEIIKNVKALKGRMQLFMATADLLYINPKQKDGTFLKKAGSAHNHSPDALLGKKHVTERDRFIHHATTMSLENKLEYDPKKLRDIQNDPKIHGRKKRLRGGKMVYDAPQDATPPT